MATIVRLKRRRNEDPLEILCLASKKRKEASGGTTTDQSSSSENVFKFAGTVTSKEDGISKQVKDAIRKEKLEREFKRHQANIVGHVRSNARVTTVQNSEQNRFTVISKHRAIALDELDHAIIEDDTSASGDHSKASVKPSTTGKCESSKQQGATAELTSNKISDSDCSCALAKSDQIQAGAEGIKSSVKSETDTSEDTQNVTDKHNTNGTSDKLDGGGKKDTPISAAASGSTTERMFNLVDMVSETDPPPHADRSQPREQITCNSQPMIQEIISERPVYNDDEYVYDIYYTNSQQFDVRLFERDLTFESLNTSLMLDRDSDVVEDHLVYAEDDDDENEENNWRNDYPDEDPRFVDPQRRNYLYDDLSEDAAFETETGNQLADWMTWRCNIDGAELSSDNEETVDLYGQGRRSYEAYYREVQADMENSD